ncbi:regulatory protein RecX [Tepidiforma sp.]|uniref:regulatory protein RecX n=1 Tax=Tepidiforma sp. TaxID=2682230 RepID=UPI002ADDA5DD|nr:regulatory protein RecX [Tepidiforma sp.]
MDEHHSPPEPLIIAITPPGSRRRRIVTLSDGRELVFSDEACERVGVQVGMTADADLLEALEREERRANAHEAALRLLDARPRSEHEMRTRLALRGFDPDTIAAEIDRLRGAGLLDDQRFARAWVEDRKRVSPRGTAMLRYELLGRGIDPEAVDAAVDGIDDLETATRLALRRGQRYTGLPHEEFLAKVGGFLRRRGFDYQVTAEALRRAWAELQQHQPPPGA